MNERLAPIPTPSAQLWRQLRLQYLPVVVFVAGVLGAYLIWSRWVAPPTMVGEAEAVRAELRASQSGTLTELEVDLFQPVTAGQLLGRVLVNDPKLLEASLAVVRAEIEVLRTTTDMNFERLRLDWMGKRVEQVALRSELQQAAAALARTTELHRLKLVTDAEFDQTRLSRDGVAARLQAQTELISQIEPALQAADAGANRTVPTAALDGLRAAIKQREEQLRLIEVQLSPLPLLAPIDGIVSQIFRHSGEIVSGAEPILQISATRSARIVGFLRQPLPIEPKPGTEVEVWTRTHQRRMGVARIAQVGQQLEPITPTLLAAMRLPVSTVPTDFGLRIHITVPGELALRPGEHVDIIIKE